jgi:hypothetical protein
MKPIIYISKRCIHCRKLLMILQERPHLKGHYQIVSIDDSPFPKAVKTVPCMIIDDQLVNSNDLFKYILSTDGQQQGQKQGQQQGQQQQQHGQQQQQHGQQQHPQQRKQEEESSCSVEECIDGICSSGSCLDFAPIDENSSDNFDIGNYSFLDEPEQSTPKQTSGADQGSEKRQAFDNDYERMMSDRGELMSKPSFA